jgi:glycosyltransferase involved in cell wall biosynthesis
MRVLYDTQLLGFGHHTSGIRAGLYRYAEELAKQLVTSPDCDVEFFAGSGYEWARTYLRSNPKLREEMFHMPSFSERLIEAPENSNKYTKPMYRLLRKLLSNNVRLSQDSGVNFGLGKRTLDSFDVIHFPYNTWGENFIYTGNLKKFITIHDIIPLVNSSYFNESTISHIKKTVDLVRENDFIITDSQSTKNDLSEYQNINPDNIYIVPLAADSTIFRPCKNEGNQCCNTTRKKYGIPDVPYVLSLSTLEPRKNLPHVIRCFADLVKSHKIQDLNLVLAGMRGWKEEEIFAEIENADELKERIITTGFIDDEDLSCIYSNALVFVYMSFYEGFGLPPLEAMSCGVPVITSNTSSLPEVVGDAGVMHSPTDEDSLKHSILQFYSNSDIRSKYSNLSLIQSKQFSWETCGRLTIDAYQSSIGYSM